MATTIKFSLFISLRMTCTYLYHMTILKKNKAPLFKSFKSTVKLYNREIDTAAKWVSSGTTYVLRNGKNTVHMSRTKLKDSDYIS